MTGILKIFFWKIYRKIFYRFHVWEGVIYAIPLWFSILKHKSKKTVVFNVVYEGNWSFVQPVIDQLLGNDNLNIVIAAGGYMEGGNAYLDVNKIYYLLKGEAKYRKYVWYGPAARFIKANVVIAAENGGCPFPIGAKRIHIFHTLALFNTVPFDKLDLDFDFFFLTGPSERELFDNHFLKKRRHVKQFVPYNIGYPKLDIFLKNHAQQLKIKKQLNHFADCDRPVIIYAPTWGKNSSLHLHGEKLIENLLELNINLYVKLHPFSMHTSQKLTEKINWIERLDRFNSKSNFYFIKDANATFYFTCSDMMISDVSGAAVEFVVAAKKPLLLMRVPGEKTNQWVKTGFEQEIRKVSVSVNDVEQAINATQLILKNPGSGQEPRDRFSESFLFNPGNAAKCAADKIREIIEEPDI